MTNSSGGFVLEEINDQTLQEEVFTIRIPAIYKMKYAVIQARSRNRFAPYVREKIIEAIDSVEVPMNGVVIPTRKKESTP